MLQSHIFSMQNILNYYFVKKIPLSKGEMALICIVNVGSPSCRIFYREPHPTGSLGSSGAGRTIIGGANIHISLLTDCKNNRFQKKLITQNTNILIFAPPIIDLPAPLLGRTVFTDCDTCINKASILFYSIPSEYNLKACCFYNLASYYNKYSIT